MTTRLLTDDERERLPFGHCRRCGKPETSVNCIFCDECNREMAQERHTKEVDNAKRWKIQKEKLYSQRELNWMALGVDY